VRVRHQEVTEVAVLHVAVTVVRHGSISPVEVLFLHAEEKRAPRERGFGLFCSASLRSASSGIAENVDRQCPSLQSHGLITLQDTFEKLKYFCQRIVTKSHDFSVRKIFTFEGNFEADGVMCPHTMGYVLLLQKVVELGIHPIENGADVEDGF